MDGVVSGSAEYVEVALRKESVDRNRHSPQLRR